MLPCSFCKFYYLEYCITSVHIHEDRSFLCTFWIKIELNFFDIYVDLKRRPKRIGTSLLRKRFIFCIYSRWAMCLYVSGAVLDQHESKKNLAPCVILHNMSYRPQNRKKFANPNKRFHHERKKEQFTSSRFKDRNYNFIFHIQFSMILLFVLRNFK